MEKMTIEPVASAEFTERDIAVLKRYFEINKKYYDEVNKDLLSILKNHPLWGSILQNQTPEQQKKENERSLELQRAAIFEGKWEEYYKDLIAQGKNYARMNFSYNNWYELVKLYKDHLIPYLKEDLTNSREDLVDYLDGLSMIIDYAMRIIAEAYFEEKNNVIKAEEERFRLIFENSTDSIYLIDKQKNITLINHSTTGLKKEEVIGKSIFNFLTDNDEGKVRKALETVFKSKIPVQYEILRGEKYFSSSVSPVLDEHGNVSSAVAISRDITLEKTAERKIKELNDMLEKKVSERTAELEAMNKELESFSYSVSHDLRAPIRAINGFSEIIKKKYSDKINEDGKELLDIIVNEAKRMGQLIDDLLSFSRLGRKEVQKVKVDMKALADEVVDEVLKISEEKYKAKITVKDLPSANCDMALIHQVFFNLLTNALKFSKASADPMIEIGSYSEPDFIVYYVKDNGIGFDMKYIDKLFGVFQRLNNAGEYKGTGIGLAIVKKIIDRHGGKAWAEGKVNEGATFYFSLPK